MRTRNDTGDPWLIPELEIKEAAIPTYLSLCLCLLVADVTVTRLSFRDCAKFIPRRERAHYHFQRRGCYRCSQSDGPLNDLSVTDRHRHHRRVDRTDRIAITSRRPRARRVKRYYDVCGRYAG